MNKFLIVGCTSGIGKALAQHLLNNGHSVIGAARNTQILQEISTQYPDQFQGVELDLQQFDNVIPVLNEAVSQMQDIDVVVISSSIIGENPELTFEIEKEVILTNVIGWTAVCIWAAKYFEKRGSGHLVGITSLAKYLASVNPSYIASKAFEGKFLDGLRLRLEPKGIWVTEIIPGFVDTPMIAKRKKKFWAIPADKAALAILKAITQKKRRVVISKRWKIFRFITPHLGAWLQLKFFRE